MTILSSNSVFFRQPYFFKKHDATRLHYDLRLGWNGTLLSWAVPEGPSYCVEDRRDAIRMENHRREYGSFEGVHPTGTIMLWDRGMWELHPDCGDIETGLRMGMLRFTLYGEKLKGLWKLTWDGRRQANGREIWMLSKEPDLFARDKASRSILEEAPDSISTNRSLEEIRRDWFMGRKTRNSGPTLF